MWAPPAPVTRSDALTSSPSGLVCPPHSLFSCLFGLSLFLSLECSSACIFDSDACPPVEDFRWFRVTWQLIRLSAPRGRLTRLYLLCRFLFSCRACFGQFGWVTVPSPSPSLFPHLESLLSVTCDGLTL